MGGGVSTEYNIDMDATTENNVNVYNFLNGLLSSITCDGKEINHFILSQGSYIRFYSIENSAYEIQLYSDGRCNRSQGGGGAD